MSRFQHESESKARRYENISRSLKGVLGSPGELPWETALVSLIALLKQELPWASWVGFYRSQAGHLFVGPYQGPLACVHLKPGQGVCGQAFNQRSTLIVADVTTHPGHVACDAAARSEIVVPVWRNGELIGVLDLDSHEPAAFDAMDQENLEQLLKAIEPMADRAILSE